MPSDFAVFPRLKGLHVQEAESFQEGLQALYEALKEGLQPDEEIAAFYEGGKEVIRVHEIKMVGAERSVLFLAGIDESGRRTAVAGHFTSMNIIYRTVKLEKEKERTPIGFSKE